MRPSLRISAILLLAVIILPISVRGYGNEEGRRDGNWWVTAGKPFKESYVVGFFDGLEMGANFSIWGFDEDSKFNDCVRKVGESFQEYTKRYIKGVTNVQIVDGLNELYSDYKNRRILVSKATWLVLNGIAGTPKVELDQMIESFRRSATQ